MVVQRYMLKIRTQNAMIRYNINNMHRREHSTNIRVNNLASYEKWQ